MYTRLKRSSYLVPLYFNTKKLTTLSMRNRIRLSLHNLSFTSQKIKFCLGISRLGGRNCFGRSVIPRASCIHKKIYPFINYSFLLISPAKCISFFYFSGFFICLLKTMSGLYFFLPVFDDLKSEQLIIRLNTYCSTVLFGAENYIGCVISLSDVTPGVFISFLQNQLQYSASYCRSSGSSGLILKHGYTHTAVLLPSKEVRLFSKTSLCRIGSIYSYYSQFLYFSKAGFYRRIGYKPRVRGVAKNPIDHKHGGGEGRCAKWSLPTNSTGSVKLGVPTVPIVRPVVLFNKRFYVKKNIRKGTKNLSLSFLISMLNKYSF